MKREKIKGEAVTGVFIIVVAAMLLIPIIVYLLTQEGKWSIKERRTTAAYQAAETGVDRAIWKLNENPTNWASVAFGGTVAGYTGNTVYNVYASSNSTAVIAQYKVNITSGASSSEVLIISKGRDISTNEIRTLQVSFVSTGTISGDGINFLDFNEQWQARIYVHWGKVTSYTTMDATIAPWFPRKYCAGPIIGRDTDPTPPNTDGVEYWAFQNLGTPPQVNLAYYAQVAKNSVVPVSVGGGSISPGVASPAGSGYFPASLNGGSIKISGNYYFSSSTSVIYTDGDIHLEDPCFEDVFALICEGTVNFNSSGIPYTANVPSGAAIEYVKQVQMNPGYTYPGQGSPTYTITQCGFHGFLYSGGQFQKKPGAEFMCGVLRCDSTINAEDLTVYYDPSVTNNIKTTTGSSWKQNYWKEIQASW